MTNNDVYEYAGLVRMDPDQHHHDYDGQRLTHSHEGGRFSHGYFGHSEDAPASGGARTKFLVTIQAWVYAGSATTAENIAIETTRYLEEANEDPSADPTEIQTCIVHKAPFLTVLFRVHKDDPLDPGLWIGSSCEADIEAEDV